MTNIGASLEGAVIRTLRRAGLDVGAGGVDRLKDAGRFDDVFDAELSPRDLLGVLAVENGDFSAVYDELSVFRINFAIKFAMNGVVFDHVSHVLGVFKRIVDAENFVFLRFSGRSAENQSADSSETIDTEFNHSKFLLSKI
jgi:hypothetical protein